MIERLISKFRILIKLTDEFQKLIINVSYLNQFRNILFQRDIFETKMGSTQSKLEKNEGISLDEKETRSKASFNSEGLLNERLNELG